MTRHQVQVGVDDGAFHRPACVEFPPGPPVHPSSKTSRNPLAYWRAIRSRSAARAMIGRSDSVGGCATSCSGARPRPPGLARRIAANTRPRVFCVDGVQHARQVRSQVSRAGRLRQRGQQQQDAEVGVGSHALPRGLHRLQHRPADGVVRRCVQHRGDGGRTDQEIRIIGVVKIVQAVDVAGLARRRLPDAGGLGVQADEVARRHGVSPRRTRPQGTAPRRRPRPRRSPGPAPASRARR